MDQDIDIFVSYAHLDDRPLPGVEVGWVTNLIRALKIQLARELGRPDDFALWMDYELSGNKPVTPEIMGQVARCRTLLLVLSKPYLASAWCQKEMAGFLTRYEIDSGRVFAVQPEPVDLPPALADLEGYPFYEVTPEKKVIRYGHPQPNPDQVAYYQRIDDLAREMAAVLQHGDGKPASEGQRQSMHTVLLAPVSGDLQEQRETTRRFLEQQQIRVLPARRYPPPPDLESRLQQDLAECDLFIQLLSADEDDGWPAYYHHQALAAGKPRLLWHGPETDPAKVPAGGHRALFDDDRTVASDVVELQREILKRLQPLPEPPGAGTDNLFLFVNHAPEDRPHIQPLLDELELRGIGYSVPLSESEAGSAEAARKDLENNLLACDALLILYYQAPPTWAREQLNFWRRTFFRRDRPARGLGLCKRPDALLGLRLQELHVVDCPDCSPCQCLDQLVFLPRPHG